MANGMSDQLVQLPTGAGKTVIFVKLIASLVERHAKARVCILVPKVVLVPQTIEKLEAEISEEDLGMVCGTLNVKNSNTVTVASVESILNHGDFDFNVIIVDEAHRMEKNKSAVSFISKCREQKKHCYIIRFTATPYNIARKPVFKLTLDDLITEGYLADYTFKSTKETFDTSQVDITAGDFNIDQLGSLVCNPEKAHNQVEDALSRTKDRNKAVWTCVNIEHAELIRNTIQKYGEEASIVHSKMSLAERLSNIQEFENGNTKHLVSITIVAEGYDYPAIDAVVLLRPTRSPVLYVQMVGRGLRLFPGKEDCLVLDYGEVYKYLGSPNSPKIRKKGERRKSEKEAEILECPECRSINFLPASKCKTCGYVFYKEEKKPVDKNLTESAYSSIDERVKMGGTAICVVKRVTVKDDFESKKGNKGVRVEYTLDRALPPYSVFEYFMYGTFKEDEYYALGGEEYFHDVTHVEVKENNRWFNVLRRKTGK